VAGADVDCVVAWELTESLPEPHATRAPNNARVNKMAIQRCCPALCRTVR
jgi:hypothetical protein